MVGVILCDRRAADHDFGRAACFFELFDYLVDLYHGGRHECAKTYDIGFIFHGCLDDFCRVDVFAEIDKTESAVGEQCAGDVFAEIVDVALYRGDDDRSFVCLGAGRNEFFQAVEGGPHGFGGKQNLRQEHPAGAEVLADVRHSGSQGFFGDFIGIKAFPERLFD